MRTRALTMAIIGASLTLAACGGGSSSNTGTASAGGSTPRAAFRCLTASGLKVKSTAPNQALMTSSLVVDQGKPTEVHVSFMKSPAAAKSYADKATKYLKSLGTKGSNQVVAGTVVVGTGQASKPSQVSQIDHCLSS